MLRQVIQNTKNT